MRTGGQVRFVKVSARIQKLSAAAALALLVVLLGITGAAVIRDLSGAADRAALARQQAEVAEAEQEVAAYQGRVAHVARDLSARQDYLEQLTREYIGPVDRAKVDDAVPAATETSATSGLSDEWAQLAAIDRRQRGFANALTRAVNVRAARAEAAIRQLGINPARLSGTSSAQGGPFVPYRSNGRGIGAMGREFVSLDRALMRMEKAERALVALPSDRPANVAMVTSSYGYRRDPFTGAGAFHAGLDFRGAIGTPIFAASAGRVSFVGQRQGYGNVVEIDHGQGIVTRYAHLSGFAARIGQRVRGGDMVARMGSTGRSTGPHLHFEVRLNGAAMDPRKFLETNKDVLEIKAVAARRIVQHRRNG